MHEILYNAGLSVTFGVVGIILLIIGYCAFDKVLTKIDFTEELKDKNIAVAIVIAGFMIAIGVIISGVVS
ncbi:DUF350 domain-containing protein [Clostridium botulinum]|uniref:DUF350 domain-containing protein n=1 Tax=Clostridium botulinum TaxID=1491 RepID=A0A6B4JMU1_CLOBO|nr:DUF350 domain-containing protein [Clostridium botulinum]EES48048.1 hypothetical protein CLO_2758 [Clostridium botulinum E1 str. 'BoNT E Beluga']MBY6761534.1 DUF350 domain-containing protein [Clostridium botulinum]MBY6920134.1 DUF350 domain-containing protein [Clostridium botulinum]MCR1131025.1 DUF350 domain-containing protein [Clostridium botulinum]NFJ58157.1 DUF350 domain-containing protein [Clostridium botulinum]